MLGSRRSLGGEHGTHSSILAWKIPWTEETGGLQSIGSQRVGQNSVHTQAAKTLLTHFYLPGHTWDISVAQKMSKASAIQVCACVCMLSCTWLFVTPGTVAEGFSVHGISQARIPE